MKKLTIALALLTIGAGWTACKKSKKSTADPVIATGMQAKINGVQWNADPSTISVFSFGNYVEFTGYDTAGNTLDLRINNFKNRGTYSVPQANDSIFFAADFGALASPTAATTGTIVIEAVNDTAVGGTFSFTAGSKTVTGGTFYWNY